MQRDPSRTPGIGVILAMAVTGLFMATGVQTANAQADASSRQAPKSEARYYVDFRARTAASYGHAFVWYGRVGERRLEVAGLHPASDSVLPYIIGHILPVPSETGKSYGDLDDQYLTAHYRVVLTASEARQVFAYIKQLQGSSPVWNALTYNCTAFIGDIARFMGLETPSHLLYPEDYVNGLRSLNRGRKVQLTITAANSGRPSLN